MPIARRPVRRIPVVAVAAFVIVASVTMTACSGGSTSAPATTTAAVRTGRPMVRVIGDGVASIALEPVAEALDTTDLADRSVARSTVASWLDIDDRTDPDVGSNHRALATTLTEDPDLVLLSLGADLVPPTADREMELCQPVTAATVDPSPVVPGGSADGSSPSTDCARAVLEAEHHRQRVMAIVFDVLAHTRTTKVVLVGSGGEPGTIAGVIDAESAAAAVAVAEAGGSWRDRIAWSSSPSGMVTVLRQRGWV